jgi:hypothetical protein
MSKSKPDTTTATVTDKAPSVNAPVEQQSPEPEKLYVNTSDQISIKSTLDNDIDSFFSERKDVKKVETHSNVILSLGVVSILITAVTHYFTYLKKDMVNMTYVTLAVALFFILQFVMTLYQWLVQKQEVYRGVTKAGVFTVSVDFPAYELDYTITMTRGGHTVVKKTEITQFFDTNTLFLQSEFRSVLADAFEQLEARKTK